MKYMKGLTVVFAMCLLLLAAGTASAQAQDNNTTDSEDDTISKAQTEAAFGAAIAMAIAGMASAIGLMMAGSAAAGATAENPDSFGKNIILQGLPMTQVIYAFVVALIIAMGMGLTGGDPKVTDPDAGMAAIGVCLIVGLTGLSAIPQGVVATSSIAAVARNPDVHTSTMIYTVMPETTALFGFVIAFLVARGFGFL